jgi:hypothetical protein
VARKDEHIKQARHNEKLAATLAKSTYLDWAVTAYFYSALHYVQAFLAVHAVACDNHADRLAAMERIPQARKIVPEYQQLVSLSRQSRYDALPVTATYVTKAEQFHSVVAAQIRTVMGIKD